MKHIPGLDGLRAIAVIAVIFYHLHPWNLPGAWIGVDIFFVLSGFLITRILANEQQKTGRVDLKQFFISRFLRLAPALIGLLVVVSAFTNFTEGFGNDTQISALLALLYVSNWNMAFAWLEPGVFSHTWSLSTEEQFYFLWPLLFVATKRGQVVWIELLAFSLAVAWRIMLAVQGASWMRVQFGFDTHCTSLLLGCILALRGNARLTSWASRTWPLPAAGFLVLFFALRSVTATSTTVGVFLSSVLAGWILLAILGNRNLQCWLSRPALLYTGKISYGLYLWHPPVIASLQMYGLGGTGWRRIAFDLVVLAITFAIAGLSYRFLEKPFLDLKDRIRLRARTRTARVDAGLTTE